jgi:hypothetical protein
MIQWKEKMTGEVKIWKRQGTGGHGEDRTLGLERNGRVEYIGKFSLPGAGI